MTRSGKALVAGAVLVPVLAAIALRASVTVCPGPRYPDKGNLHQIAEALVAISPDGDFPMKDGALDVYAVVRAGEIVGSKLRTFRSARSGTGPTDEEIARGDYTNFPWERCRGAGRRGSTPFPLLWESAPDDQGEILVALSDGHVYFMKPERLDAALKGAR